ncbi:MAG: aminotransferase class V-fold PLP-dependent enzyme [Clostridia bacterium]|nr:aminotransferase class V-fold PLP-dependent enzyme [Clostridia bacterium]
MIYLDNAATSLKKPNSLYPSILKNTIINSANAGRGGHFYSLRASELIYKTSESLCELFNIKEPEQIAYMQNATMALNSGILGMLDKDSHVIITQMEHNSVLRPVHKTCEYTMIKADKQGRINIKDIEKAITKNTKMIICTHASNVCGTIMPIDKISKIAHRHGLYFMVDAAQTAGSVPIDVQKTDIDILAFSGHKGLMMPMGTGGIYVKNGIKIKPVITGGTGSFSESLEQPDIMPDMLQSGTLNAPAIISAKKSIDFILREGTGEILKKETELSDFLINELNNIKNVVVHSPLTNRNGTVAFNIKNMDSVEVADILNTDYKICTRGGWHCAYPAHCALGTQKSGAIRASFGYFNSKDDAKKLVDAIYKISQKKFKNYV